jgi:hypothetical protein
VLIAAPELLTALQQRVHVDGELFAFVAADALQALEVITERRPQVVFLEHLFAATPRGIALVDRIHADPSLEATEIRIVSEDGGSVRVEPRDEEIDAAASALAEPEIVLDRNGTRRAPRYRVDEFVEVLVDGNTASVVDLSIEGAQVLSPTVLKPNQRVRVSLADEQGVLRFNATVAWAAFEIPPTGGPRYRAGVAFIDADGRAVESYALRHRA